MRWYYDSSNCAVVPQADIALVREQTRAVRFRLADRPAVISPATTAGQVPSATAKLPSEALGARGGGTPGVERTPGLRSDVFPDGPAQGRPELAEIVL